MARPKLRRKHESLTLDTNPLHFCIQDAFGLDARATLLELLKPRLSALNPRILAEIAAQFDSSANIISPKQLAGKCNVSRRTIDRQLRKGGLASIRPLLAAVRIAQFFEASLPRGSQAVRILHLGVTPACLRRQCIELTGLAPSVMMTQYISRDLAEALAHSV